MVAAKILFLRNKTQEEISAETKVSRPTIAKATLLAHSAWLLAHSSLSDA